MPYVIQQQQSTGTVRVFAKLATPFVGRYHLVGTAGTELPDITDLVPEVVVPVLGGGGFGVVVQAIDPLGFPRAIKIIDPDRVPRDAGTTDVIRREIKLTNVRPLKHTIPILDFDRQADMRGIDFAFYVMPFVTGLTIGNYWKAIIGAHRHTIGSDPHARGIVRDLFLGLTTQVLMALEELHDSHVVHMDISSTNLMVDVPAVPVGDLAQLAERSRAFLIDLGAAKDVSKTTGHTILIMHRYYFPTEVLNADDLGLSQIDGYATISYAKLHKYWRLIDLYCFAKVLEELLLNRVGRNVQYFGHDLAKADEERDKEAFWRAVLTDDFDFITRIIDRLLQIKSPVYSNARRVREMCETLRPTTAKAAYDSSLLTDKYPALRIRAGRPLVKISPPLDLVVDHPAFQRLKRLNQLAFISEIFPGATHSRFTHSLQTFDLMKRYVFALCKVTDFRLEFQRQEVDETLTAALIHDVGQYPFSHAIEDLRKMADHANERAARNPHVTLEDRQRLADQLKPLTEVKHDQELSREYMKVPGATTDGFRSIADILSAHDINVVNIEYMIAKTEKNWEQPRCLNIARDLVAGVIDADRVSYLRYDSDQTGIPYGLAVDLGSLIEGLTIRCDGREHVGLAIEEGAVGAAEAVLASVYWMYRNVYWHHTNRGFMAVIKYAIRRLLQSGSLTFDAYANRVYNSTDIQALQFLHAEYEQALRGDDGANPLEPLVTLQRLGYKRICTIGLTPSGRSGDLGEETAQRNDLYRRLVGNIDPDREDGLLEALRESVAWHAPVYNGDILIDVPLKPRLRWLCDTEARESATLAEGGDRKSTLWVKTRKPGTKEAVGWKSLQDSSLLASTLSEIEDVAGRKIRVFLSRALISRMPTYRLSDVAPLIEAVLREVTASRSTVPTEPL